MAEVYRAQVLSGSRQGQMVAVKRLLPEFADKTDYVNQFITELDLTKILNHPNIVQVYEVGIRDGFHFMVMELIEGRDLGQILRRCKDLGIQLPLDIALYLGKTLFDTLAYAHGVVGSSGNPLNIVHCDISPSNFFISRFGEVKLGDFGMARTVLDNVATADSVVGKPYYLSPEALGGSFSSASDLWAATVTLYEILTLERPFIGKALPDIFSAIRKNQRKPLQAVRPEISKDLEAIIEKGFAKEVHLRYLAAAECAEALARQFDDRVGTALSVASVVRSLFQEKKPV